MSETGEFDWIEGLFVSITDGRVDLLEKALAEGFDPHRDLSEGLSIVSPAVRHGEATLARVYEMIDTVDIRQIAGYSPLQSAVMSEDVREVRALLRHGASVEWTCDCGDNVFHIASPEDIISQEVFDALVPHATLHALLTHSGGDTPISDIANDKSAYRLKCLCRRYVELGGSLDVKVGVHAKPMRYFIEQVGLGR